MGVFQGGGMTPNSESFYLSSAISYHKIRDYRKESILFFQSDPKIIQELYEQIRSNNFDNIQVRQEKVYDRGGISVQVTANKEVYNKSDSGMTFIRTHWRTSWKNVLEAADLAKSKSLEGKSKIPVSLQLSVNKEPYSLGITIGRISVYYEYQIFEGSPPDTKFEFVPGKYSLVIETYAKGIPFMRRNLELAIPPNIKQGIIKIDSTNAVFEAIP
ncbi:hypothetical protein [Leptospira perolatii]|nr:hypothetical protein [Leptospira perolatii]